MWPWVAGIAALWYWRRSKDYGNESEAPPPAGNANWVANRQPVVVTAGAMIKRDAPIAPAEPVTLPSEKTVAAVAPVAPIALPAPTTDLTSITAKYK